MVKHSHKCQNPAASAKRTLEIMCDIDNDYLIIDFDNYFRKRLMILLSEFNM